MRLTIFKPLRLRRGVLGGFPELLISKIIQRLDLPELRQVSKVLVHTHVRVLSTLDATLKVTTLPLDGECPCRPTRSHPSDLIRNVKQCVYRERACWESFRPVLVVQAKCVDRVSLRFSETKRRNTQLIIYYPFTNSRLDFVDFLRADLELKTEVEDPNQGAEMIVIAVVGKAISKQGGGDEQRP